MIRTMLDSDDLAALGHVTPLIATYADLFATHAELAGFLAAHPGQQAVFIDRGLGDPLGIASVLDIESGAHQPGDLPGWWDRQHGRGVDYLTAYSDRELLPVVIQAAGRRHVFHWVATLDGTVVIAGFAPLAAPAVVQIAGESLLGVHADLSLVLEDQWHPQP